MDAADIQPREQRLCAAVARHLHLRRDFHQWHHHKRALGHPRMRNRQARLGDHALAIQRDIEVQRARPIEYIGHVAHPAVFTFDGEQGVEQCARRKFGAYRRDGIHKIRLIGVTHRRATV